MQVQVQTQTRTQTRVSIRWMRTRLCLPLTRTTYRQFVIVRGGSSALVVVIPGSKLSVLYVTAHAHIYTRRAAVRCKRRDRKTSALASVKRYRVPLFHDGARPHADEWRTRTIRGVMNR